MPDVEFTNLFAVTLIALLAPLLLGLAPRLRVPAVVLEIVAGIIIGPHGLGLVEVDEPLLIVSRWDWDSCSSWPVWRSMSTNCADRYCGWRCWAIC